jgi:hypothetical protein
MSSDGATFLDEKVSIRFVEQYSDGGHAFDVIGTGTMPDGVRHKYAVRLNRNTIGAPPSDDEVAVLRDKVIELFMRNMPSWHAVLDHHMRKA